MNDTAQPAARPARRHRNRRRDRRARRPIPMRKVILIALGLLLILFVYHVLSDRFTPYTSQARVEAFLTQVAPEVAGDVAGSRREGQWRRSGRASCCSGSIPNPMSSPSGRPRPTCRLRFREPTFRSPTSPPPGRRSSSSGPIWRPAANWAASSAAWSAKRALPETQGIRAHADTAKSEADLTRAQADLRKAQANLGAPGLRNPKVRQALAALDQARLDLRNTEVRAPARRNRHQPCGWRPANMSPPASRC